MTYPLVAAENALITSNKAVFHRLVPSSRCWMYIPNLALAEAQRWRPRLQKVQYNLPVKRVVAHEMMTDPDVVMN